MSITHNGLAQPDPPRDGAVEYVVRVRNLCNAFGKNIVHRGLSFDLHRHEILGLVGASGAGKSLLMRSIIGLQQPQAGEIEFSAADQTTRPRWGVLFQDAALFSSLTMLENVLVPLREYGRFSPTLMRDVAALKITLVGLKPESFDLYPAQISGGMRKRTGLARALALDPQILFLDEPTAGLDPGSSDAFIALIAALRHMLDLTIIIISHDVDCLFRLCDRIAVLAEHKISAIDTIPALANADIPALRDYFAAWQRQPPPSITGSN